MHPQSCAQIRKVLGKPAGQKKCTLDEGYEVGEKVVFHQIARLIREEPSLDMKMGKSLFLLSVLGHAVQDRKHMEGFPNGVNALEHYIGPGAINSKTDKYPDKEKDENGKDQETRAVDRTTALLERFDAYLKEEFGEARAMMITAHLKAFKSSPEKTYKDYFAPELLPRYRDFNPSFNF
jgi:hypothetical protein